MLCGLLAAVNGRGTHVYTETAKIFQTRYRAILQTNKGGGGLDEGEGSPVVVSQMRMPKRT